MSSSTNRRTLHAGRWALPPPRLLQSLAFLKLSPGWAAEGHPTLQIFETPEYAITDADWRRDALLNVPRGPSPRADSAGERDRSFLVQE